MNTDQALSALRPRPTIAGELVLEAPDAVRLRAGGAIVDVPRRFIVERQERGGAAVELVLAGDAVIVVSTVVSARKGFVADDVFGALSPGILSDNCNCNCNCSGGDNCNCNCNCNCDCGGSGCAGGVAAALEARALADARAIARPFRRDPGSVPGT